MANSRVWTDHQPVEIAHYCQVRDPVWHHAAVPPAPHRGWAESKLRGRAPRPRRPDVSAPDFREAEFTGPPVCASNARLGR